MPLARAFLNIAEAEAAKILDHEAAGSLRARLAERITDARQLDQRMRGLRDGLALSVDAWRLFLSHVEAEIEAWREPSDGDAPAM